MKRILTLFLGLVMCMSIVACGQDAGKGSGDTTTTTQNVETTSQSAQTTTVETTEPVQEETYYKLGDTVSTDIFEFTLNSAEYTVALSNINNESYFEPKEYDPQSDTDNPYVAPVGHTYAAFSYTVNNLNRASSTFHNGSFATVEYDGKSYSSLKEGAYFLYEDKMIMDVNGKLKTEKAGEWYSKPGSNFLLMTGAKETRRAYVDISADIKDLTEDMKITFAIPNSNGEKTEFTYLITETDRDTSTNEEIEMTLDLALVSFTEKDGQAYFASHMNEYSVITGDKMSDILLGKWSVDYIKEGIGSWSGDFWFEEGGTIKDTYGYVNERTWRIDGDMLIIDEKYTTEMRKVSDHVYLLISDGKPFMLMQ